MSCSKIKKRKNVSSNNECKVEWVFARLLIYMIMYCKAILGSEQKINFILRFYLKSIEIL